MPKVHYQHGPHGNACGRAARLSTTDVFRVTCRSCGNSEQYIAAMATAQAVKMEQFLAQEPRVVKEPWKEGTMECSQCGWDMFREAARTCYGHYANYVCAACGNNESRLTETGMSF